MILLLFHMINQMKITQIDNVNNEKVTHGIVYSYVKKRKQYDSNGINKIATCYK